MSDYVCPYCGFSSVENETVTKKYMVGFQTYSSGLIEAPVHIWVSKCPHCNLFRYRFHAPNPDEQPVSFQYPPARMSIIPDYVPAAISADYREAVSILNASPKASATLSRRCLQGMIHDFWNIHEKNLNAEITELREKVPADQWMAIDALRKLGNIGAHMEADVDRIVDIDPDEAEKLLRLIELLIKEWYIARNDAKKLYAEIAGISDTKEADRRSDLPDSDSK